MTFTQVQTEFLTTNGLSVTEESGTFTLHYPDHECSGLSLHQRWDSKAEQYCMRRSMESSLWKFGNQSRVIGKAESKTFILNSVCDPSAM